MITTLHGGGSHGTPKSDYLTINIYTTPKTNCNQYFTDIEQTLEPILSRVLLTGERETLWKGGGRREVSRETSTLKDTN